MAFTRSQATGLLNQAEMGLFDDSRAHSLRGLDASQLGKRIERSRKARDRARDLLKRQKLASRSKTGSKRGASGQANERTGRKAELLADILGRFEDQLKQVGKRDRQDATKSPRKPAAGKDGKKPSTATKASKAQATPNKTAASKPAARKAAPGKTASRKTAASKAKAAKPATDKAASPRPADRTPSLRAASGKTAGASGKSGSRTSSAASPGAKPARKDKDASRPITPKRALANTRKLLEAKRARQRQGLPWQTLDPGHDHLPQAGYPSRQAAEQAEDLHAGESRITPIQGSISTRDRKHQGKRDHRRDSE
jgi:hypothetical protein